jgi:hypothetical protein
MHIWLYSHIVSRSLMMFIGFALQSEQSPTRSSSFVEGQQNFPQYTRAPVKPSPANVAELCTKREFSSAR